MADEFKIVASLDVPKSVQEINKDIPKLQGQTKHLKIIADLDPKLSIKNIQATLNKMNNNANIKIGIDTSGLNSVQGATQNITNNLKNVQTQAQQTASAVRDIGNVGISDNVFKKLLQDMQISKSVTNEYKQSLRALANELTTAWDTRNEELYLAKLKEIINVIGNGQKSFKLFDKDSFDFKEITSQIIALKSAIGVGVDGNGRKNKFFIDDNLKKELAYIQGSDKAVRSLLNSLYGLGNWTFDERKFGFTNLRSQIDKASASADSLYAKFSNANFGGGNIANFITETAGQIDTLKAKLNTKDTLNGFLQLEMGIANADKQLEIMIADALKLKDFTSRRNDPLCWFEEIIAENEKVSTSLNTVQKEARETSVALGEIGHNFISNNQVQATFSSLKQAEEYFKGLNLGQVSVGLNKGSLQGLTDFTIKVKSATGEIERFRYAVNNIGDDQNPILEYNLTNINASNEAVQRLIQSQQKAQDKLKALRTNLTSDLKSIRSAWQDVNGGKSVKSDENIERLKQQYIKVTQAIRDLRKADDTTLASMKANADAQIDKLNQMVTQYHNAEKVATQLRAKGFETVKIDTGNNIDKFINSINNSKVPIQAMQTEINKLTSDFAQLDTIQDQAGKSAALTNILNTLDNAKTKFQSLKELFKGFGNADWISVNSEQINKINDMATKIAIYKNNLTATRDEWKSQGIYVGEIQSKVTSLARSLPNIKKPEKFNEWVQEWNDINQKANQLKTNLDSQVATHNKIYEIQAQIAKLNPTKDNAEITRLNEKLALEQRTLSNLQMQSNVYTNLLSYEQQEKYITEQTAQARDKLLSATNAGVKQYQTTITNAIGKLQGIANSAIFKNNASNPQVTQTKQEINSLITAYQNLATKLQGNITPAGLETVRTELTQLNARFNTATATAKQFETELKNDNGAEKLAQRVALLKAQIEAYAKANPKAMKKFGDTFNSMIATLNSSPDKMNVDRVAKEFQTVRQEINKADLAGKTFFQNLKEKAAKFTGWMSMTYAISLATRTIRNMITEVVNLDTALIDLKKTFGGTDTDLKNLYISANKTAKELGVTTKDILEQASAWSRLGYSSAEAAETMAKNSAIFKTISPGMDLNTATDGLVSMMKAFDIEANDVLDGIMSKVNIIGNKFATDNSSIVEAMTRSSAAMAAANNTLEETIALNTASIEITRNAETTATAWRTVSMRLRGYDESTEELSDDLKNITGDIADLTKTASNGGKGISLFTDESRQTYKSTYEIIKEISKIWNELSDKNQAELLEKLAGKRNSQVVAAAIQNFATAEKAMDEMANSQGNAMSEMEIAYESISYKINQFKESIVGLGQTIFEQDALKWLIDRGTDIIEGLDTIIEKFGVLPTVLGGTAIVNAFKNVGEQQNTPVYAQPQLICA